MRRSLLVRIARPQFRVFGTPMATWSTVRYPSCCQKAFGSSSVRPAMPLARKKGGKKKKQAGGVEVDQEAPEAALVDLEQLESKMESLLEYAKKELNHLRGAAPSANMLDHVRVEAYGEEQPLSALAQVQLKGANLLTVTPFDPATCSAIAYAITVADLGLNPSVDQNVVRVPLPKPSKETRMHAVKQVGTITEGAKQRLRRARQNAMDKVKKAGEGASSDELHRLSQEIERIAHEKQDALLRLGEKKKEELAG